MTQELVHGRFTEADWRRIQYHRKNWSLDAHVKAEWAFDVADLKRTQWHELEEAGALAAEYLMRELRSANGDRFLLRFLLSQSVSVDLTHGPRVVIAMVDLDYFERILELLDFNAQLPEVLRVPVPTYAEYFRDHPAIINDDVYKMWLVPEITFSLFDD